MREPSPERHGKWQMMQTPAIFMLLTLISLLAIPGFLIATLVRKGQRKKMLKLAGLSTLIFAVSGAVAVWMNEIERERDKTAAEQGGFESVEDYRQAKAKGYTTKEAWSAAVRELEERVAKVPASDYEENIRLYTELRKLNPENERYEQKISYYKNKLKEAKQARAEAEARAKAKAEAEAEAQCRQDIQCWGEKNLARAEIAIACKDAIEEQARYQAEWTSSWLEKEFDRWSWYDRKAGIINYIGNKVKFQNGFGAWRQMAYRCTVDTEKNLIVEIDVRPLVP